MTQKGLMLSLALLLCLTVCGFARNRDRDRDISEDSLQAMVTREPDNAGNWFKLGALAARNNQIDLAKGYFDEAIKLSDNSAKAILDVGDFWMTLGKLRVSMAYLMPNLAHMDPSHLDQLQFALEKEKLFSAQLLVLRNLGVRTKEFKPVNQKTAILAFRLGELPLCQVLLAHFIDQLDYESARNLLLVSFFTGATLETKTIAGVQKKFPLGEIGILSALNYAQQAKWREVRDFLKREANSVSYRDYYFLLKAMEAASEDRNDEAAEALIKAQEVASWDRLRVVIDAELYRLYTSTGNKFKADQIWETLKEEYQEKDPDVVEFMGKQMQQRGYEKQSKYFFRVVLRRKPGDAAAMTALWDDLMGNEDYQILTDNIKAVLDRDPLSCEGNMMAMNFHNHHKNDKELVPYARNATVYCYDAVEPYYVLGNSLMNLSKPDEAKASFATFIRKGGDANRVPLNLR